MVTNKLAKNRKSKRAIEESNNVANKKPKLEPNNGMAYGRAGNNDRKMQDSIKNQKPAKQRNQQSQRFTKNVKVGRSTMIDDLSEQDMTSSDEEEGFDDEGEEDVVEGSDESENDIDNEDEEEKASKVSSSEDVDDEEEEDGNVESDEEEDADEVKEEEKLTKEEDASGTEDEEAKEEEVGSGSSDEEEDVKPSKKQIMNMRMAHLEEGRARTVFVGNVPVGIKRKTIKEIFSPFGKLEKVYQRTLLQKTEKLTKQVLAKDKQNELGGRLTSTNFFVRFSQETEAEKAVKQLQGTRLEGHTLRITLGNKHKCDHKRSIFIGNLPFSTTEEQARAQFRQFGPVSSVRLLHNKENGQNRGCGYVEFAQKESVAKALGMDGREFMGRKLRVAKVFKKKKVTTANPVAKTTGNAYNGRDRNPHLDDIPKRAEKFLILKRNGNSGAVDNGKTESQKREGGGKKKPGRRSIRSQKWRQKQQKDGGGGKRKSLIT